MGLVIKSQAGGSIELKADSSLNSDTEMIVGAEGGLVKAVGTEQEVRDGLAMMHSGGTLLNSYTMWIDGRMETQTAVTQTIAVNNASGSIFLGIFPSITFPKTFSGGIYSTMLQPSSGAGVWVFRQIDSSSVETGHIGIFSEMSYTSIDIKMTVHAIGRWK
ncbi:MAG: hypothetical protein K0U20_09395 [Proteobacteria bacterium]|nr:hypothetical protein [Pseudomonadota bacterium]MCH9735795.1 hypothetical protein [Actinomycetes bacterium]